MTGKDKCRMLKEIRRKTAEANGIPFNTDECKFKGECKGTCPKCEAELKYINEQLERRKKLGAAAAAVVMSAGMLFSTAACTNPEGETTLSGDVENTAPFEDYLLGEETIEDYSDDDTQIEDIVGEVAYVDEPETVELDGEVAYIPDDESDENDTETENAAESNSSWTVTVGGEEK